MFYLNYGKMEYKYKIIKNINKIKKNFDKKFIKMYNLIQKFIHFYKNKF